MLSELENLARRLEQQIASFEQLHTDEMKRFQEQFETLQRLQNDELQMLRNELTQLKTEIEHLKEEESSNDSTPVPLAMEPAATSRATLTVTRRELLTGKIPPPSQR